MSLTYKTPGPCTDSPERVLDSLISYASTAERICERIEEFLDRCRGNEGACGDTLKQVSYGHFAQLERLNKALARADELARELADIG